MPVERTYERQVAPRGPVSQPLATGEQYGAGLGRGLEEVGGALHRAELRAYQLDRQQTADQEAADFDHRFALVRQNMGDISRTARSTAPEGAAGHALRMREALDAGREGTLGSVTEDAVRLRAQSQWDEFATRFIDGEADFEEGKRVAKLVNDTRAATDIAANLARRDPTAYKPELQRRVEAIDAMAIDADTREKLIRETGQVVAIGYLNGVIDTNPGLAGALLDAGAFDDVLAPPQIDQLRSGAQVEVRRNAAATEHQANVAQAALKEKIATLEEYDRQGVTIPEETLVAAETGLAQLGDTSGAAKLAGIRANNAFAKVYERQTPVQRERREAALAGKVKRSVAEDRELKWLQDHRGALDARFNSDPAGALGAVDGIPALDFEQPSSIAARVEWARAQSAAVGRPVQAITLNEARQLRAVKDGGYAGKLATMEQIARLPGREAQAAARLIDPQDVQFQHLVTLPAGYRKLAIEGKAALDKTPRLLDPNAADYRGDRGDVETFVAQDRALSLALRVLPLEQRQAILSTATQIFAGAVADGDPIDASTRLLSINLALGAVGRGEGKEGGLSSWNNRVFLLPERTTARQFSGAIFTDAARRAAAARAVNPDGSRFDLKQAWPVMLAPGVYGFRSSGGRTVVQQDGKPYLYRVPSTGSGQGR